MKKIKIFLASSNELKNDRIKFEKEINRKSRLWKDKKICFELQFWEEQTTKMSTTRSQDESNKKMQDCDIFVLLAYTKVGKYTKEEFDLALSIFEVKQQPQMFIYFKDGNLKVDVADSLLNFKKELDGIGHFPAEYNSFDNLWNQFNGELDRVITKIVSPNFIVSNRVDREEIETIEDLISHSLVDEALGKMRDVFEHDSAYTLIMKYSASLREAEGEHRRNIIDLSAWLERKQQITLSIIKLLKQLKATKQTVFNIQKNFSVSKEFKQLGNIKTKMIPIFPYLEENPLKIENVVFDYYTDNIYNKNNYNQFYSAINKYIADKKTIYNEAKPNLLDYNIVFREEDKQHYIELELGICGYIDFLAVNRNLDSQFIENSNQTSIKEKLQRLKVDKDPTSSRNDVPKQLGVSSIVITKDNYVVFQKRQKSEIASKMFHVSIAEGLQVYSSYKDFLDIEQSNRYHSIIDRSLSTALYRGLYEELGVETSEVNKLELLSIYFDYELQQPIFQTSSYLNISSSELSQYFKNSKGRDTLSEINKLNFIPNKLNDILLHVSTMEKKGKWSSHAIINIISFIERYYGNEIKLKTTLDKYFPNISNFYLGKQKYIERVRSI